MKNDLQISVSFICDIIVEAMRRLDIDSDTLSKLLIETGYWELFQNTKVTCIGAHAGIEPILGRLSCYLPSSEVKKFSLIDLKFGMCVREDQLSEIYCTYIILVDTRLENGFIYGQIAFIGEELTEESGMIVNSSNSTKIVYNEVSICQGLQTQEEKELGVPRGKYKLEDLHIGMKVIPKDLVSVYDTYMLVSGIRNINFDEAGTLVWFGNDLTEEARKYTEDMDVICLYFDEEEVTGKITFD